MSGAQGVQIEDVDLPDSLKPGDRATARIDMSNTSNFINPWNANRCNEGNNYGLLVEGVLVGPNGEEYVGNTVCAKQHDIVTTYEATSRVSFEVPDYEGTHRYEAYVRMAETGEESNRVSESINVFEDEEDAPVEASEDEGDALAWYDPGSGDGSGDGSDGPLSDLFGDDNGLLAKIDLLILAIAGLGSAYVLGQLFDIQLGGGA